MSSLSGQCVCNGGDDRFRLIGRIPEANFAIVPVNVVVGYARKLQKNRYRGSVIGTILHGQRRIIFIGARRATSFSNEGEGGEENTP
jgi:hypothetical protein